MHTFERVAGRRRWLALALIAACGCGSGKATVSGRITYKDQPVRYGSVIFVGPDQKAGSAAINPDGTYTIDGLTPGEARIGVISRDPEKRRSTRKAGKESANEQASGANNGWVPLPRQAELPDNSGITCILKAGANALDIEVK